MWASDKQPSARSDSDIPTFPWVPGSHAPSTLKPAQPLCDGGLHQALGRTMAAWSQVEDASLLEEMAQWAWSEAPGSVHALPSQQHWHSAEHSGACGLGRPMACWRRRVQLDFGDRKRREGRRRFSHRSLPLAERPSEDASNTGKKT